MTDPSRTNQELLEEISTFKRRIQELAKSEAERKRAEEEIRIHEDHLKEILSERIIESEQMFRTIVENSYAGIYISDDNFRISYVNDKLCEMSGYTSEELFGMDLRQLIAEESLPIVADRYLRRQKGEDVPSWYTFIGVHKNGEKRVLETSAAVLTDSSGKTRTIGQILDITERKQAEEKYRRIFENAQIGIFQSTGEGRFFTANRALADMLGYDSSEDLMITVIDIPKQLYVNPADRKLLMKMIEEQGPVKGFETQLYRKDGSILWVSENQHAVRDAGGRVYYYEGFIEDITDRKRAEESLRDSEARSTLIMDNITDRIWLTDMNFKILWASESVLRDRGYQLEEMNPLPFEKLLTPNSLEIALKAISEELTPQRLQQKDLDISKTLELELFRKDGSTFWSEVKITVLRGHDGTPSSILGVGRDITERKRAEEELRKSEENYRHLFENTGEGILIAQGEKIRFANPALIEILGYPRDIITTRPFTSFIHPEDRKEVLDRHLRRLKGESVTTDYAFRIVTANGTERWLQIKSRIISWDGMPASLSFVENITERRDMESRLIQAQKLEAIGTLAGGMAHNFNNILTGIQGYASLMLMSTKPDHPHYERLKSIEEQVKSGAELTQRLLGFARGGQYETKSLDINQVLSRSATLFGKAKKEVVMHLSLAGEFLTVLADQNQLEQVFLNLFMNAAQAMPGGGEIYLETENVLLDAEQAFPYAVEPGKYVKITVTDTGTGMDEKTKERIFDPFFTTKEMGRGTGLGLATVYGIIKGHKGMIDVDSEPGHGTTFTIYLPASEKEVVKEKVANGFIARGTETILLVDDEKMILEVSGELLESMGYKIYVAGNGQEALAIYMEKKNEIDLVILDMIMPGISGGETYNRLKEINPDIRVLLSSGYSLSGEAQTIMDRGCSGFLQKPFHLENLARKVREFLGG